MDNKYVCNFALKICYIVVLVLLSTAQHSEEMLKYAEIMSLSKVITEIAHTQSHTLNGVQNVPSNNTIIHPFNFAAYMQSKAKQIG